MRIVKQLLRAVVSRLVNQHACGIPDLAQSGCLSKDFWNDEERHCSTQVALGTTQPDWMSSHPPSQVTSLHVRSDSSCNVRTSPIAGSEKVKHQSD